MNRLRDLREKQNKTQTEIAEIINCTQSCYSKYELGQRDIPNEALIKLALYFKTSTDYILGLTNDPRPYKRAE